MISSYSFHITTPKTTAIFTVGSRLFSQKIILFSCSLCVFPATGNDKAEFKALGNDSDFFLYNDMFHFPLCPVSVLRFELSQAIFYHIPSFPFM